MLKKPPRKPWTRRERAYENRQKMMRDMIRIGNQEVALTIAAIANNLASDFE